MGDTELDRYDVKFDEHSECNCGFDKNPEGWLIPFDSIANHPDVVEEIRGIKMSVLQSVLGSDSYDHRKDDAICISQVDLLAILEQETESALQKITGVSTDEVCPDCNYMRSDSAVCKCGKFPVSTTSGEDET